jgi:hypothetical protein
LRLCAGAVVDGFKINDPVTDAEDGKKNKQIVDDTQPFVFGFIKQKDENVGDNNVYAAVILGGGRSHNSRIGVKKDQSDG